MSELAETVLVGLPNILEPEETHLDALLYEGDKQTSLIMRAVTQVNPLINMVIDHDCHFFLENEIADLGLTDDEAIVQAYGIELGYQFIVGCLTSVYVARSGCSTVEEYLALPEVWSEHMPVQSLSELERVKQVREGAALLDPAHKGYPETSADLAEVHLSEYLFDLVGFDRLYGEYAFRMCGNTDNGVTNAMMNGFQSGAANAVEMYMQSAEERLINTLRNAA